MLLDIEITDFIEDLIEHGHFGHISLISFLINTLFVWVMVHFLYNKKVKKYNFYFTFMLLSVAIFFLVFFMVFVMEDLKGKTSMGVGIGLFGIFSIMRYRTDPMPVREMTYLLSVICLSVINALGATINVFEMLIPNVIVVVAVWLCEIFLLDHHPTTKLIQYDRIALIKPEKRDELIADLRERTGLDIVDVKVGAIDFLRDSAVVKISYNDKAHNSEGIDNTLKLKKSDFENVD
ncbi:MAG: DUF4956 domain-containing protein [Bacteroidales bacterium]|nr:DUF4956 domain-containing protein [Candidatus Sodaliphilus aphodohippi]